MIHQRPPGVARPDDDASMRWLEWALALAVLTAGVLLTVLR
jgi:hypothetical protein